MPALAGLGAPDWNDAARGMITGMTHATTRAHLPCATFEAICLRIADVFTAMQADIGHPLQSLRADGGASGKPFLMQLQADVLLCPVLQSPVKEVGALRVAAMALTHWNFGPPADPAPPREFQPVLAADQAAALRAGWTAALARV